MCQKYTLQNIYYIFIIHHFYVLYVKIKQLLKKKANHFYAPPPSPFYLKNLLLIYLPCFRKHFQKDLNMECLMSLEEKNQEDVVFTIMITFPPVNDFVCPSVKINRIINDQRFQYHH